MMNVLWRLPRQMVGEAPQARLNVDENAKAFS